MLASRVQTDQLVIAFASIYYSHISKYKAKQTTWGQGGSSSVSSPVKDCKTRVVTKKNHKFRFTNRLQPR